MVNNTSGRTAKAGTAGNKGEGAELLEFAEGGDLHARIRVVGVGGGGGNAVDTMLRSGLAGVEFIAANTDAQALEQTLAPTRVQMGAQVTRGLGCGADPAMGREAAMEDRDKMRSLLSGADMVFVTAGLGGGTGTGAAPVIAEIAREVGALTVGVVTRPFAFEGSRRTKQADQGMEALERTLDTLITIPNDRLLSLADRQTPLTEAFKLADHVLLNAVKSVSDLITVKGLVNLDFADVRTIMGEMGMAMMGAGSGSGENRAHDAAQAAISSPLLQDLCIEGARGVLINVTGGADLSLWDVSAASSLVQEAAHEEANIIFGAVIDESIPEGEVRVTVVATGLERTHVWGRLQPATSATRPLSAQRTLDRNAPPRPRAGGPLQPETTAGADEEAQPPEAEDEAAAQAGAAAAPEGDPHQDRLDIPAFMRRRAAEAE